MLRKKDFLLISWIYSKSICLNHLVIEILYVLQFYLLKTNHKLHIYFIENSRQSIMDCLGAMLKLVNAASMTIVVKHLFNVFLSI